MKATFLVVLSMALLLGNGHSQSYQLTDLGSLIGANSYAQGVNNNGQVVGYWEATNGAHAFLYQNGVVTDLGRLGILGPNNYALSINNLGQVVGFSVTTNGAVAFVYQQGTNALLDAFGGLGSYAFGINDNGQIVGHVATDSGAAAFLFNNGVVTSLGTLGGSNSFAYGINNSLQVAGASLLSDDLTTHAFLWQSNVLSDLNQLMPGNSGWELVEAHGISDIGNIAGWGMTNGQQHAFIYYGAGWAQDLGTLAGGTNSYALGLNNSNQIVGASSYTNGTRAVLWQNGTVNDLNKLISISGWNLAEASGINDRGQIVGWGLTNGFIHAFLLLPPDFVSVVFTNPANNTIVRVGSSVSLGASATSAQGTVSKVQFFQGKSVLATLTNAPYTATWTKPAAGSYALTARATDSLGLVATSSVVSVIVDVPPTVILTDPANNSLIAPGTDVNLAASVASTNGVALVQFYAGSNWVGSATNAPYSLVWSNVQVGAYKLSAVATDNLGLTTTSAVVSVLVDVAPSVTVTNPANSTVFRYGSNISLGANAGSVAATITKVQLFQGATVLATLTNAPYTATWTRPAAGTYALTARATDNFGLVATSSVVLVIVDVPPTVMLTNPVNNSVIAPRTDVNLAANAASTNGLAQVQFLAGTNLLGNATNAPYSLIWSNVQVGAYKLSAVATDNLGLTTTSAVVSVMVDVAPSVTVTNPASSTVFRYGSNISLGANAGSVAATVTKVQLFQGATVLATLTNAPYTATWTKPAAGTYALTARATDSLGLVATSSVVSVIVDVPPTVTLTNPANNSVIAPGTDVNLVASAASTNGLALVQFLAGTNVLGNATNAPYSLVWSNVQVGAYKLSAVAMDNLGVTTTSAVVSVLVDVAPSVTVTNPANSTVLRYGSNVGLGADAGSVAATITKVQLFQGATVLATLTNAPYTATWTRPAAGTYALTARATDSLGLVATSSVVSVIVDVPPTVTLTNPGNNSVIAPGTDVNLAATAASTNGLAQVQFLAGTNVLGNTTNAPYSLIWSNVQVGAYKLSAVATDSLGLATTSAVVSVLVDVVPSVTVTNPVNSAVFRYGSNVSLGANVGSVAATITKVQLFQGATVLATLTNAPYTATWTRPAAGTYAVTARATDNFGLVTTSSVVSVIVDVPPTVTLTNPANNSVIAPGTDVNLAANATSTNGLAQVQFLAGTNVVGSATNVSYSLVWSNVPVGTYKLSAVATDNLGLTTTSAVVSVLVDVAPSVTVTNPAINAVFGLGTNVNLGVSVATIGGSITKVQYFQGATVLATLTNAPYSAVWTKPAAGTYTLTARATDSYGLISTSAPVSVYVVKSFGSPVILAQPANQIVIQGSNTTLSLVVSPTGIKPVYKWYFNSNLLASTTNASLAILNAQTDNAGTYFVVVTNSLGSATSSNALVTVLIPPSIVAQPANQVTMPGSNASFTVTATGTSPLGYQWYFNGTNQLIGATNITLIITNVQTTNAGYYSVSIANVAGNIASTNALLSVTGGPVIVTQPSNQTVVLGSNVTFSVDVSGSGPFSFQWQCNGTNLPSPVITTVAGNGVGGSFLNFPSGVVADTSDNLFIADSYSHVVREVPIHGVCTIVAGNGSVGNSGDGGPATAAAMVNPTSVAVDSFGDLFIADAYAGVIREVNTNGIIITVAGNGNVGYSGDGGAATNASLNGPFAVAVDSFGDLFIANTYASVIRELNTNGIIITVAGNGNVGYSGDGRVATSASLRDPLGVAVDVYGNLFIADTGNNVIREVNTNGIIFTVAGDGNVGYSGDGGVATSASLSSPSGVAVDVYGNLLIADTGNNVIREINTNGIIITVAGNGYAGYSGDGGVATNASLSSPPGVATDAAGNLFIADKANSVIRAVESSISGQLTRTLMLRNVTANSAGEYSVIISNLDGSVTSRSVSLTILTAPSIILQPADLMVAQASDATFRVTATGTAPFSYQWYFNGTNLLAGATNSTLIVTNVQNENVGKYSVTVANSEGSVNSLNASMALMTPIRFSLAMGGERIMELTTNGDVVSWGGNQFGELGDYTHLASTNPVHVVGLNNVTTIASGPNHSLAIDFTGVLWAWGNNQFGQLGNGGLNFTNVPVPVLGMTNPVIAVAGGEGVSAAITVDGAVWNWGTMQYGPCSGSVVMATPTAVTGFTNAIAVAAGIENFLALTSDGAVWAWGSDGFGQFGDGIFSEGIQTPVQVSGLSNIVAICSGYYHCLALDTNGQVWAWGLNSSGQLGDNGAEYDSALPVLVFSNATQIAAGIAHSLAVDTQGKLWAWGSDSAGQLGDAGSASINIPTQVLAINNVVAIAAGSDASAALDSSGNVWQWGSCDGDGTNWVWNGADGYPQQSPAFSDNFSGILPNLQILSGNNQTGHGGAEFLQPLVFQVTDTNGLALSNAPVSVEVISGDMELRVISGGANMKGIRVTTDVNGQVSLIGFADNNFANKNCLVRVLAASREQIVELDFTATLVPPPTVNITSPAAGSFLIIGTNKSVTITVDAEASAGFPVREVDYYYGTNGVADTPMGVSTSSPYSFAWTNSLWTNAFVGQYTLSAVVVDVAGAQSDSQSVGITVALDSDGIGIPDCWQLQYFGNVGVDPNSSPDGNGNSLLYDYQNGFDPTDYYDGKLPTLECMGGNDQFGNYGSFLPLPVIIQVTDANSDVLTNAPIVLTVTNGTALLAATTNNTPTSSLTLRSDTNGKVTVWAFFPPSSSNPPDSTILASAFSGSNSVSVALNEYVPLGHWTFNNTNTWVGEEGQLPLLTDNLVGVPSWSSNAVLVAAASPALLAYNVVETYGNTNICCQTGSVMFWFKPVWSSVDQGGSGPGTFGRLIEIGNYNPAFTNGWWSLYFSPDGTQLMFGTSTNGYGMTNLTATTSWVSNEWHQIALTYSPTASVLYVDGQLLASGAGVTYWPNTDEQTNGFRIGSDLDGNNQANGAFDELVTFNYPLNAANAYTHVSDIPDWWEVKYFNQTGLDPEFVPFMDGQSVLYDYQNGVDPTDYYAGLLPNLTIVSGNNQVGNYDSFLRVPITIQVTAGVVPVPCVIGVSLSASFTQMATSDNNSNILTNAPIVFTVTGGTALLAATNNGTPTASITVETDANGLGSAWIYFPPLSSNPPDSTILASAFSGARSTSVTINEYVPLGHWTFNDTNSWVGEEGQLPWLATNIIGVPSWSDNAVRVDSPSSALLAYNAVETNGNSNISFQQGSLRFWFKPDWSSANSGGNGPGEPGRLIEAGNPAFTNGWWSLYFSPDGTQLLFGTSANGATMTNLCASISWISNQWHQILLTYSPTGSVLYVDGRQLAGGSGVTFIYDSNNQNSGFRIGSDQNGNNQAGGAFEELETFGDPLNLNFVYGSLPLAPPTIGLVSANGSCLLTLEQTRANDIASSVTGLIYPNSVSFLVVDNYADSLFAERPGSMDNIGQGINLTKLPPPVITPVSGYFNYPSNIVLTLGAENLTNMVAGLYQAELARAGNASEIQTMVAYAQALRNQGNPDEQIRAILINGNFRNSAEYINKFGGPGDLYQANTNDTIEYSLDNGTNWTVYTAPIPVASTVTLLAKSEKAGSSDERTHYAYLDSDTAVAQFEYIPASWLMQYFGTNYQSDTNAAPDADPDHDGLSNLQEYGLGFNPTNADSIGDGLGDAAEAAADGNFNQRLGYWRFNTTDWLGEEGQVPLGFTNLISTPDWSINALEVDTNLPAYLAYQIVETNGNANILPQFGSVRFWLKTDWNSSTTNGGSGPGTLARLIEIGSQDSAGGWWALVLSADGTTLSFVTQANGIGVTNLSGSINWTSNDWHQVVLTYSATNSLLYLDAQLTASGSGVTVYPDASIQTNGFCIGSDHQGNNQAGAKFDELETFNFSLSASTISNDYNLLFPDGNGPVDYIGYIEGLNPLVYGATVPDTNGMINLQIYTPLHYIYKELK